MRVLVRRVSGNGAHVWGDCNKYWSKYLAQKYRVNVYTLLNVLNFIRHTSKVGLSNFYDVKRRKE